MSRKLPEIEQLAHARESKRKWRINNPKACAAQSRKWKKNNPEKVRFRQKLYRLTCRPHRTEVQRKWRAKNKDRINARDRERRLSEPAFRLRRTLACRINKAIRRRGKSGVTSALVGCDISFLMGYIEARFKPGMTWKNYGTVWEIDHRIPCAAYDLSDPSHQRSCFHYTNLQPLFSVENRRKNATLPGVHQAEML